MATVIKTKLDSTREIYYQATNPIQRQGKENEWEKTQISGLKYYTHTSRKDNSQHYSLSLQFEPKNWGEFMKPTLVCTGKKRNHIGMFQCRELPKKKPQKNKRKTSPLKNKYKKPKGRNPIKNLNWKSIKTKETHFK